MKLHETLRGLGNSWLSPRTYLVALETGGALAFIVALALAPLLALLLVLAFFAAGGLYMGSRWTIERQVMRAPCPQCGKRIRKEASICRYCTKPVEVARWLTKSSEPVVDSALEPATIQPVIDVPYAASAASDSSAS